MSRRTLYAPQHADRRHGRLDEDYMALVVLLRGVNIGGYRTFRPSLVAQQLRRFDVVNVGAAGTFVVRKPIGQAALRAALVRLLPFDTRVIICRGSDILRLVASDPMANHPSGPQLLQFVSVLARRCAPSSPLPLSFPATGRWGLRAVGQQGRFVYGVCRREMKAIGHMASLDRLFGVPSTTRSWNTIVRIARLLEDRADARKNRR